MSFGVSVQGVSVQVVNVLIPTWGGNMRIMCAWEEYGKNTEAGIDRENTKTLENHGKINTNHDRMLPQKKKERKKSEKTKKGEKFLLKLELTLT